MRCQAVADSLSFYTSKVKQKKDYLLYSLKICFDMSSEFIKEVCSFFVKAFDKFRVMRISIEAGNKIRREEQKKRPKL